MNKKGIGNLSSSVLKLLTFFCVHITVRLICFCSKFHSGFSPENLVPTPYLPAAEQTSTYAPSPSALLNTALSKRQTRADG